MKIATLHVSVTASFIYITFRYITHSGISQREYHMRSKYNVYMYVCMYIADIVILKCVYDSVHHKIDAQYT